jgi:hypothetical protein
MSIADNLSVFELPKALVEPSVRACRLFNTMLDVIFYDVPNLTIPLANKDAPTQERPPFPMIDFDALTDPEGSLLLFRSTPTPNVDRFNNVERFLSSPEPTAREVEIVAITGVGSSALGSAAFAWDIATALQKPVLAIVPGYGLADLAVQALGGWFGFGLHNFLQTKSLVQNALATAAPKAASIGRNLSASAPDAKTVHGAPIFRYGSGSSDVLHDLLEHRERPFELLIGHSKGALQIGNAIESLPPDRTRQLRVVTLGCPIPTSVGGVSYYQYLGLFDALGQINMWGNLPNEWVPTWHSTDPWLPPAMATGDLVQRAK